jgi:hypothetical protein
LSTTVGYNYQKEKKKLNSTCHVVFIVESQGSNIPYRFKNPLHIQPISENI